MFKRYPLSSRFACFVLIPLLLLIAAGYGYLRRSLPAIDGQPRKMAVSGRTVISRDAHGIVYIEAGTDDDAYFALGYAHAQDRLWQLELERRLAQGRLSEIFGRDTIQQDAWMRTLGLYASAASSWTHLSPEAQASLTAYANGINARLAEHPVLPPEFLIMGIRPEPWRPLDSLAWSKVFALNLAGNMWDEISNSVAAQYLTGDQMQDLLGYRISLKSTGLAAKTPVSWLGLQASLQNNWKLGGKYVGSNAWAVSGKYMQGGQAALANDPHLGLQMPSLWYAAQLKGKLLDAGGMTLVGMPVIVFGHNASIAWGGTSMMADVQDLRVERINPDNAEQYWHDGRWTNFGARVESIGVKADFPTWLRAPREPVKIRVRTTVDGPVVSDVIDSLEQPMALRWTALDPDDASYEAFYRLGYATDWQSFREAFRGYVAPALNMVYIDKANHFGSFGVGRIPLRLAGDGQVPEPGWDDTYRWTGYIPFKDWPQTFDPPSGYVVSANNKPVDDSYPYFISSHWAPPARALRIGQLLKERIDSGTPLTVADFGHMQADTKDLSASSLLAYLKQVKPANDKEARALAPLQAWNGDMQQDSPAAALFFVWSRHLGERLFANSLQTFWNRSRQTAALDKLIVNAGYDRILAALTDVRGGWCEATGERSCASILRSALDDALAELARSSGSDPSKWSWGGIHYTYYAHTPFSKIASIAPWFERRVPNGGSPNSIDVANAMYQESDGYRQTFGAGFRQIMQQGSDGVFRDWLMNSTGQSGNVLSRHYADMVVPFRNVDYTEMKQAPASGGHETIVLLPN
ncbi:penicillin acylase family protein [Dyella kyungheensis]|uniref:penicillin acylase family protein n=1 Tax=Dyella kyungheensis TaxID=1242174 RepID=UPI003CF6AF7A